MTLGDVEKKIAVGIASLRAMRSIVRSTHPASRTDYELH